MNIFRKLICFLFGCNTARYETYEQWVENQNKKYYPRMRAEAEAMATLRVEQDGWENLPKLQRALSFYYFEPYKLRQYMTTNTLIDSALSKIGIVIPEEERDDKDKAYVYFKQAEEKLNNDEGLCKMFEDWARLVDEE